MSPKCKKGVTPPFEVEGITDLLLQVTKAADTADTTVTHSYFPLVIIWHIELHY